ncbi:MAG: biotin--[acetyl-CoA-carboxylase] ligase, partial [Akkermansiaceae bacterium]
VAMLFALAAQAPPAARDPVMGRWSNPKGTLAVETHPCPDGTLCGTIVWASADAQAAGRGREGAGWFGGPGQGLPFSVIVTPSWRREQWGWLSLAAGLAVCEWLEGYELAPEIKWPNDVLLEGRKLCGILIETVGDRAVIGIGLNVNERSFPEELEAISLVQVLEKEIDRETVMLGVWSTLLDLLSLEPPVIAERAWELLAWRNCEIETAQGMRGRIRGFGENAELKVEGADCLLSIADADGVRLSGDRT